MTAETPEASRKTVLDALLLKLPGVSTKKINNLDAYFIRDRMFACITGKGVGLRLSVAMATELQFSRADVVPFQPAGTPVSREWVQIECDELAGYEKDLALFQAALEFVKAAPRR
ncbi:MAG: hypothetical protein ACREJT_13165 [Myxococcota bacterium]